MIPRYGDTIRGADDLRLSLPEGVQGTVAEMSARAIPDPSGWLAGDEWREMVGWRSPRRRDDWLRGRYLAKRHLVDRIGTAVSDWREMQILTRDESTGRGTPARVSIGGQRRVGALSIAHSGGWVGVVSTDVGGWRVGIDLVVAGGCPVGFAETWFTDRERSGWTDGDPNEPLTMWAAKEAWFKASGRARFEPRRMELRQGSDGRLRPIGDGSRGGVVSLAECDANEFGDSNGTERVRGIDRTVIETGRAGRVIVAVAVCRVDALAVSREAGS